jgi:hypothetical protein
MIMPTSWAPSKWIKPKHVSFVWVLPSANVIGIVPCNNRPIGKAFRMGSSRNPLNPVSTMAVKGNLVPSGPETSMAIVGLPEAL